MRGGALKEADLQLFQLLKLAGVTGQRDTLLKKVLAPYGTPQNLNCQNLRICDPGNQWPFFGSFVSRQDTAVPWLQTPGGDLTASWLRGKFPKSARSHLRNSQMHVLHI